MFRYLVLLMPIAASASSVFTISCSHGAGFPITNTNTDTAVSCIGGAPTITTLNGAIRASGTVSFTQAPSADQFSTLYTSLESLIKQGPPVGSSNGPGGSSRITMDYEGSVLTQGTVRPGFALVQLDFSTTAMGLFYDGNATVTSGLAIPGVGAPGGQAYCGSQSGCISGYQRRLIPVTLGTPITLSASGVLANSAGGDDGLSGGFNRMAYQFRFLEADGTTPVASTLVPEPRALTLTLMSLAMAWASGKRVRPNSPKRCDCDQRSL